MIKNKGGYMITMFLRIILVSMFVLINVSAVSSETGGDFELPPAKVVATVRSGQPYHAGMTKEELYRIYPVSSQQSYHKEGSGEWILFKDILAKDDDLKHMIVFYLKDNIVSGWKTKEMPKTPEERYQTVLERQGKAGSPSLSGGPSGESGEKGRRPIYEPPRIRIEDY
jgi:hypothetical protein